MGVDILPYSKHNLDTSTPEALAADLSSRLGINVKYGFFASTPELNKLINPDYADMNFGFVTLKEIIHSPEAKEFQLIDEYYIERELYKMYGNEVCKTEAWKKEYNNYTPSENTINTFEYFLEFDKEGEDYKYAYIYSHIVCQSLVNIYYRWWDFCRRFMHHEKYDNYNIIRNLRIEMMEMTLKLGGDKVYYVDDHNYCFGDIEEYFLTWEEYEKCIKDCAKERLLNISDYMDGLLPPKDPVSKDEFPLALMDDFRNLK